MLNEKTGGVTEKISEFVNIENGINRQSVNMDKLNSLLEKRKPNFKSRLKTKQRQQQKKL